MECITFNDLIMPYLKDQLDDKSAESFELHYFTCDSCFTALKTAELIHTGSVPIHIKDKKTIPLFKPVFAFGSLVSIIVLSVFIYMFFFQQSGLIKKYYEISEFNAPLYFKNEIRGSSQEQLFDQAMGHYNDKSYQSALDILKKIRNGTTHESTNYKIVFFKGICMLLTDDPQNAHVAFAKIIANMDPSYFDEAMYYNGIALLRMGKREEAVTQLQTLSADNYSPFAIKATHLLKKLDELN